VPKDTLLLRNTKTQPHSKKGRDQDEVTEVGENPNLAGEPSDEREFEGEKAKFRKQKTGRRRRRDAHSFPEHKLSHKGILGYLARPASGQKDAFSFARELSELPERPTCSTVTTKARTPYSSVSAVESENASGGGLGIGPTCP
jgi:hypothetical protein